MLHEGILTGFFYIRVGEHGFVTLFRQEANLVPRVLRGHWNEVGRKRHYVKGKNRFT